MPTKSKHSNIGTHGADFRLFHAGADKVGLSKNIEAGIIVSARCCGVP